MLDAIKAFNASLFFTMLVVAASPVAQAQLLLAEDPASPPLSGQNQSALPDAGADPNDDFDRAIEILYHGNPSAEEVDGALELIKSSASNGHSFAQVELGYRYLFGYGVNRDQKKALFWLSSAAHQGHPQAMGHLGGMYASGKGVERNEDYALQILRRGVELGDAKSLDMLGRRFLHGPELERDADKGLELLTKAADQGFTPSTFTVGIYYLFGEYVPPDIEKSVRYLENAVRFGHPLAPFVVSQLQKNGVAIESPFEDIASIQAEMIQQFSPEQRNTIAWWMAVRANTPLFDGELAVEIMESTLADPVNRVPAYLDTLAAAYAAVDDFAQAVTIQEEAIAAFDPEVREKMSKGFTERLALYQSNQAYAE